MKAASIYFVTRYAFTARPENGETVAEGLTMQAASALASTLRTEDPSHAYGIRMMPLERQADLLASGETMHRLSESTPAGDTRHRVAA